MQQPPSSRPPMPAAATYVVNRNINYTNVCTYACAFCAFRWGMAADARGGNLF